MTAQPVAPTSHCISADHPSLPGHFPGNPVVPGVVIFGVVEAAFQEQYLEWKVAGIRKLKFLQPLLPNEPFSIIFADIAVADRSDAKIRFKCTREGDGTLLAEGNLILNDANRKANQ